jgi:hypothetical protein
MHRGGKRSLALGDFSLARSVLDPKKPGQAEARVLSLRKPELEESLGDA